MILIRHWKTAIPGSGGREKKHLLWSKNKALEDEFKVS